MISAAILLPFGRNAFGAEFFFDVGSRLIYEDNVLGLTSEKSSGAVVKTNNGGKGRMAYGSGSGMMTSTQSGMATHSGGFSLSVSAGAGLYQPYGNQLGLILRGTAGHSEYFKYDEFNSTIVGVSAGLNKGFGSFLSGSVSLKGKIKDFEDTDSDSKAVIVGAGLKQYPQKALTLRENLEYEWNNAVSDESTYRGVSFLIGGDLSFAEEYSLMLDFEYLKRDYEDAAGSELSSKTISIGVERALGKNWTVDIMYDRQSGDSDGSTTVDNIVSAGVRYSI